MARGWAVVCFLVFWQSDLHGGSSVLVQLPVVHFLLLRPSPRVQQAVRGGSSAGESRGVAARCRVKPPPSERVRLLLFPFRKGTSISFLTLRGSDVEGPHSLAVSRLCVCSLQKNKLHLEARFCFSHSFSQVIWATPGICLGSALHLPYLSAHCRLQQGVSCAQQDCPEGRRGSL